MKAFKIKERITNRSSIAIQKYLNEISSNPKTIPLHKDLEKELAIKAQNGCQASRERLILANTRFVISVAKCYNQNIPCLNLEDLIQAGAEGLIIAVDRYDPNSEFKVYSYAVWWIRNKILESIRNHGNRIRLPLNRTAMKSNLKKYTDRFYSENERMPSIQEIATACGFSQEDILKLQQLQSNLSLNVKICNEHTYQGTEYIDLISDNKEPDFCNDNINEVLKPYINKLNQREKTVVCAIYGIGVDPMTHSDCGRLIGVSGERVRQIAKNAVAALRECIGNNIDVLQFMA